LIDVEMTVDDDTIGKGPAYPPLYHYYSSFRRLWKGMMGP